MTGKQLQTPRNYRGLPVFHLTFVDFSRISSNYQECRWLPMGKVDLKFYERSDKMRSIETNVLILRKTKFLQDENAFLTIAFWNTL
jgi:hypothetical protein